MIWLKRLFFLPMLIRLHWLHTDYRLRVEQAQKDLFGAIDAALPEQAVDFRVDRLNDVCEALADIEERRNKLWKASDSKIA